MSHYLLLGAGFSRNWGGWLANEAFEYLLGHSAIRGNERLRSLLWRTKLSGGFEEALAQVQSDFVRDSTSHRENLEAMQSAVSAMFEDMNQAFLSHTSFESQNHRGRMLSSFLARFEAIFSLNQDVLLEHHYLAAGTIAMHSSGRWNGGQLPGMQPSRATLPIPESWAERVWEPSDPESLTLNPRSQPIFKIHGSSNWRGATGEPLLIIGGQKSHEIESHHVLRWYSEIFRTKLCEPNSRLMVIGYGFRDLHINEVIIDAVLKHDLKLFVVDPLGSDIARSVNPALEGMITVGTPLEDAFARGMIGASRRTLRESFGGDAAEHRKLLRFFDA